MIKFFYLLRVLSGERGAAEPELAGEPRGGLPTARTGSPQNVGLEV